MPVINLTLQDSMNRTMKKQLVTELATIALNQSHLDAFLALWAGVSGLGIISADITIPLTVVAQTPAAGSNRDEGATFGVTTSGDYNTAYKVPGILAALRQVGGTVDLAAAGVTNYFADFDTGDSRINSRVAVQIDTVNTGLVDK